MGQHWAIQKTLDRFSGGEKRGAVRAELALHELHHTMDPVRTEGREGYGVSRFELFA